MSVVIPNQSDISVKCVRCSRPLAKVKGAPDCPANSGTWSGAVVEVVSAGFGSRFDEDVFIVGICDDCIERLVDFGRVYKCKSE